jgi:hypothetical protein
MDALIKKLQYTAGVPVVLAQLPAEQAALQSWFAANAPLIAPESGAKAGFALLFVRSQAQIDQWVPQLAACLEGDALFWCCYPKSSSKRYRCDFNRDTGWAIFGQLGYEPVRQVAIDEDWSALRFRKVAYIKKITRSKSMALTDEARQRTSSSQ